MDIKQIIASVLQGYTGVALNGHQYLTHNADETVWTVVAVGNVRGTRIADTSIVVQLIGDRIIVERDVNDKPVVNALLQAGIPRDSIILAYAGEAVPV